MPVFSESYSTPLSALRERDRRAYRRAAVDEGYRDGLLKALQTATEVAADMQMREPAGPHTRGAGAIEVLRALEDLLEQDR